MSHSNGRRGGRIAERQHLAVKADISAHFTGFDCRTVGLYATDSVSISTRGMGQGVWW